MDVYKLCITPILLQDIQGANGEGAFEGAYAEGFNNSSNQGKEVEDRRGMDTFRDTEEDEGDNEEIRDRDEDIKV